MEIPLRRILKYATILVVALHTLPAYCFEATVRKVYNDLINSIGNDYGGRPQLEFSNQKKYVAYFSPNKTITFEKSAFDVCMSLGPDSLNAIAYILAHELGHHYRDHFWIKEAGSAYASLEIGKSLRDAKSSFDQVREADADEFACYHTIIAGYSLSDPGPLLKALYKEYELPEEMPNYPSLSDRIAIAQRVRTEASEMAEVFRCANFALLAKENELAIRLYSIIINNKLGSREVYNNLAVAQAQTAIKMWNDTTLIKLSYPFEIASESRLFASATRSVSSTDSIKAIALWNESASNFKKAIELSGADTTFPQPYQNLAVVYGLLRDKLERNYWLEKGIRTGGLKRDDTMHKYICALFAFFDGDVKGGKKRLVAIANSNPDFSYAQISKRKLEATNAVKSDANTCSLNLPKFGFYDSKVDTLVQFSAGVGSSKTKIQIYELDKEGYSQKHVHSEVGAKRTGFTISKILDSGNLDCLNKSATFLLKGDADAFYSIGATAYYVWYENGLISAMQNDQVVGWYSFR